MGIHKLNRQRKGNYSHKVIVFAAIFALFISNVAVAELSNVLGVEGWISSVQAAEIGLNVSCHTQDQIREKIDSSGVGFKDTVVYDEEPAYSNPYKLGKISASTKKSSIAMLNNIRYIAGLQDNVTWDDSYGEYAQAAALVNAANNELSHYPACPSGMDEVIYSKGEFGARRSNLAAGYNSIEEALIGGWMDDGDYANRDRVGHRRWVLNPAMEKTGFGMVGNCEAMYAMDGSGSGKESRVAWPAQQMPVEYFGTNHPWSLSIGQKIIKEDVSVTLTRKDDGRVWVFREYNDNKASNSGYFNVNNGGFGQLGCIIFCPNGISYANGQEYDVKIQGAIAQEISYTVHFFNLNVMPLDTNGTNETAKVDRGAERKSANSDMLNNSISLGNKNRKSSGGGDADDEDDDSTSTSSAKENIKLTSDTGTEQLSYQVTSKKSKTVAFAGVSKKATAVTVPATIKYNNKKYKVTSIKEKAFKGRTKLKNIELNGNNIRSVGDGAFKGIKKNARITITAKNKKQYNKVVKLIKESETGKVRYVYKKKS